MGGNEGQRHQAAAQKQLAGEGVRESGAEKERSTLRGRDDLYPCHIPLPLRAGARCGVWGVG